MQKRTKEITKIFLKNKVEEISIFLLLAIIGVLMLFISFFIIGFIVKLTPFYDLMVSFLKINCIDYNNFELIFNIGTIVFVLILVIYAILFILWTLFKLIIFDDFVLWIKSNWRKAIKEYETSIKTSPSQ